MYSDLGQILLCTELSPKSSWSCIKRSQEFLTNASLSGSNLLMYNLWRLLINTLSLVHNLGYARDFPPSCNKICGMEPKKIKMKIYFVVLHMASSSWSLFLHYSPPKENLFDPSMLSNIIIKLSENHTTRNSCN